MQPSCAHEQRFSFGKNWSRFLDGLRQEHMVAAQLSLQKLLGITDLNGYSFLDIGSGSGLFSLAARRLGAQVLSFDYDTDSVACTRCLQQRFFAEDSDWNVLQGSVLDDAFMHALPAFDIVYSWGVLHHTGDLWHALENAAGAVAPGGLVCLALYNDQGLRSSLWRQVKRIYCSGALGRAGVVAICVPGIICACLVRDVLRGTHPLRRYRDYRCERGMSVVCDWFDWLGGYPYEVATAEQIIGFGIQRGLTPVQVIRTRSWGNNQFVFRRDDGAP